MKRESRDNLSGLVTTEVVLDNYCRATGSSPVPCHGRGEKRWYAPKNNAMFFGVPRSEKNLKTFISFEAEKSFVLIGEVDVVVVGSHVYTHNMINKFPLLRNLEYMKSGGFNSVGGGIYICI